jgi:ADYC domain-containing protein
MALRTLAVMTMVAIACGRAGDPAQVGSRQDSVVSGNGRSLNGRSLNGRSLNGRSLNGRSLNGRSLNGLTLDGVSARDVMLGDTGVVDVALSATVFSGRLGTKADTAALIAREAFVGSVWIGSLSDGSTIPVRIDGMEALPTPNADLLGYAISYETADEGRIPYCGVEDDGSPTLAIPMEGAWNYRENVGGAGDYDDSRNKGFTFACRHAAIAKCIELGYRPWAKRNDKSLKPLTVACTRMLRADYCGTGVSYTVDGTLLDLNDRLEIQQPSEPGWSVEAEWGENGAVCLSPGSGDRFTNSGLMPTCYAKLSSVRDCGAKLDGPTLIVDRYAAPGQERFTGTWYGKATGHWGRIWMTLRQAGEVVDGSYVSEKNGFGTITGTVVGRTLQVSMTTPERKHCAGMLVGDALVDGSGATLALAASATSCEDELSVELTKE